MVASKAGVVRWQAADDRKVYVNLPRGLAAHMDADDSQIRNTMT
jgi:hypothetical protein